MLQKIIWDDAGRICDLISSDADVRSVGLPTFVKCVYKDQVERISGALGNNNGKVVEHAWLQVLSFTLTPEEISRYSTMRDWRTDPAFFAAVQRAYEKQGIDPTHVLLHVDKLTKDRRVFGTIREACADTGGFTSELEEWTARMPALFYVENL